MAENRPRSSPSGGMAWFAGRLHSKKQDYPVRTNAMLLCAQYFCSFSRSLPHSAGPQTTKTEKEFSGASASSS